MGYFAVLVQNDASAYAKFIKIKRLHINIWSLARSVAISILAFSSFSLSGARSKIVASPVLANSISLPMNASCSGVGGM